MGEMKLRLTTKFMRTIVSKLLSKIIFKQTGYKVDIRLNDLNLDFVDGETKIGANVELFLDSEEFTKIIKDIGID